MKGWWWRRRWQWWRRRGPLTVPTGSAVLWSVAYSVCDIDEVNFSRLKEQYYPCSVQLALTVFNERTALKYTARNRDTTFIVTRTRKLDSWGTMATNVNRQVRISCVIKYICCQFCANFDIKRPIRRIRRMWVVKFSQNFQAVKRHNLCNICVLCISAGFQLFFITLPHSIDLQCVFYSLLYLFFFIILNLYLNC